MNTTEKNKLISEFMGFKWSDASKGFVTDHKDFVFEKPKYHLSWDWLMPVVEKIEKTNAVKIKDNECMIFKSFCNDGIVTYVVSETKMRATYNAVITFINWFNLHKTPLAPINDNNKQPLKN